MSQPTTRLFSLAKRAKSDLLGDVSGAVQATYALYDSLEAAGAPEDVLEGILTAIDELIDAMDALVEAGWDEGSA